MDHIGIDLHKKEGRICARRGGKRMACRIRTELERVCFGFREDRARTLVEALSGAGCGKAPYCLARGRAASAHLGGGVAYLAVGSATFDSLLQEERVPGLTKSCLSLPSRNVVPTDP